MKYRVEMHLMRLADKRPADAKAPADPWQELESDALRIHRSLGDGGPIVAATLIECAPAEFSLTNHGEVSVGVRMEVEVGFCEV